MDPRRWWWLWSRCPGLGTVRMRELQALLLEHQLTLAELWSYSDKDLKRLLPWPPALFRSFQAYRHSLPLIPEIKVPEEALLPLDRLWPKGVDGLNRPPLALFWRGRAGLWNCLGARQAVAVVGTRRPSAHGLRMAEALGRALAVAGWPVVSGLAEGIDASAHKGCLDAEGAPVAVLGTPLNRVYPVHHQGLQADVQAAWLLISEQPENGSVQRGHFAARNRLVVAVVRAVVIVECPEQSGALISARLAAELDCPVLVVPGDARRWSARGSNALLLNAAAPLLSPEALVTQLGPGPLLERGPVSTAAGPKAEAALALQAGSLELIRAVADGASIEELVSCLNRSPTCLAEHLLQLELQGVVVAEPGLRWRSA
ncbi:MAG: DNA-processing protein DprA [Prochlorococcus sp.]